MAAEWIEQSVRALTNRYEGLYRWMLEMRAQIRALQQGLVASQQQGGGGAGGSSGGFYVCMAPASGTYAGTWSGAAPTGAASFTATVYQVAGTSTIVNLGSQTVTNWMPAPIVNSYACILIPDGAGNYGVAQQSCV